MNIRLKSIFMFFMLLILYGRSAFSFPGGSDGNSNGYVGICAGLTNYYGDLNNNNVRGVPVINRLGGQIALEREIVKPVRICGGLFIGNIIGDQIDGHRNLNFKTSLTAPYLGISLNLFSPFPSLSSKGIRLWLFGGVEYFLFSPMGDLKDANGKSYYYWSDGSIRTQTEIPGHEATAAVIQRDYKYETDYRNVNIDNVSSYPKVATGFPVGLSVEKKLTGQTSFRLGGVYHYTLTDYLDNITANSIGARKGDSKYDRYLFVYAGLFYRIPAAIKRSCPAMR